jgi:DNA-binding transcriptional LysR family regulator
VEIPVGVAILPVPTLARELASGTLVAVRFQDQTLSRPLGVIHRRDRALGLTASRFLKLLTAADAAAGRAPGQVAAEPSSLGA